MKRTQLMDNGLTWEEADDFLGRYAEEQADAERDRRAEEQLHKGKQMTETYEPFSNRSTYMVALWFSPEYPADVDEARDSLAQADDDNPVKQLIGDDPINWDELRRWVEETKMEGNE